MSSNKSEFDKNRTSNQAGKRQLDLLFIDGRRVIPWPVLLSSAQQYRNFAGFRHKIDNAERSCDRMVRVITLNNIEARLRMLEEILQDAIKSEWKNDAYVNSKTDRLFRFVIDEGEGYTYVLGDMIHTNALQQAILAEVIMPALQRTRQKVKAIHDTYDRIENSAARLKLYIEATLQFILFMHESFRVSPRLIAAFQKEIAVPSLLLMPHIEYLARLLDQIVPEDALDGAFERCTGAVQESYYALETALENETMSTYEDTTGVRVSKNNRLNAPILETRTTTHQPRFMKLNAGSRLFRGTPAGNKLKLMLTQDSERPFWFTDTLKVAIAYATDVPNTQYKYEDVRNGSNRLGYVAEYVVASDCRLLDLAFPHSVDWLVRLAQSQGQPQMAIHIKQSFIEIGAGRIRRESTREVDYPLFNWFKNAVPSSVADGYIGMGWDRMHNEIMLSKPWEKITLNHIRDVL